MRACTKCGESKPLENFYNIKKDASKYCTECKSCMNEANKKYRQANREKISKQRQQYRRANQEKVAAGLKAWREKNRDYDRATSAQWRKDNPELYKQQMRNWRQKNKQRKSELDHRRRARKAANGSYVVTARDMRKLAGPCVYCGSVSDITLDHVIPISRGGSHGIGNLVAACRPCNNRKLDKTVMEWRLGRPRPIQKP